MGWGRQSPRSGPGPGRRLRAEVDGPRLTGELAGPRDRRGTLRVTLLRRLWSRDGVDALTACTALDVGTEFAKALVFEIGDDRRATVPGGAPKRPGLAHMQSGTVAGISAGGDKLPGAPP